MFRTPTSGPSSRLIGASARWTRLGSALLATALFVVGPSFAGSRVLWHEHGDEGHHGHVIAGLAVDHGHHHDHGEHEHEHEHVHVPHGLLVELPAVTLVSAGTVRVADSVAQLLAWEAARLALHADAPDTTPRGGDVVEPTARHGSGVERILRSSHALLI